MRCFAGESNEKYFIGRDVLFIDEISNLSDSRHRLSAASAADNQNIIFERDNGFSLLSIKRICQDSIEILRTRGKLVLNKTTVIGLLVILRVRHGVVETPKDIFIQELLEFFAFENRKDLLVEISEFLQQVQSF